MGLYSKVIAEVEAAPEGAHIAAFFDFDGTLIHGYSATTYLREQVKRGDISLSQLRSLANTMLQFGLGNMGFSAMLTMASQYLRGIDEAEYLEFAEALYKKHIAKLVYPESRALVEAHLKKGHTVALISAATPYQLIPAARELGIEHLRCSKLEVVDGKFTGAVLKPTCYGMGKVDAAEQLARQCNVDIRESFFYSDSDEDIQLLDYVGKPRPLNPNKRLRTIARGRGWPVQDFNSRGKASVSDYMRTFAAQLSLITSAVAGLPILALTGSMNKTRNFSTSVFADTACALTGLELDIEGEEHAWSHRPCVFMFNHQSQADTLILPSILRRDLAGVGKKEIGDIPILGKVMEWGGTVLIDRENARSARESMKPLIDVMQKEGRCVCIAPEGTRSTSTNLGRFKKGGFHLAMQAGVPVVPIVIHNAIDVAPRGQYVFKPATVKVTVLPAVDTSDWSAQTINEHVHQVRDMFLQELDQMQFQPQREAALEAAEQASKERQVRLKKIRQQQQQSDQPKIRIVASQGAANTTSKTNKSSSSKSRTPKISAAKSARNKKPAKDQKPLAKDQKPLAKVKKPLAKNKKPKKFAVATSKAAAKPKTRKKAKVVASVKPRSAKPVNKAKRLTRRKRKKSAPKVSARTLDS